MLPSFSQIKHVIKKMPMLSSIAGGLLREYYWVMSSFPIRGPIPQISENLKVDVSRFPTHRSYLESKIFRAAAHRARIENTYLPDHKKPFYIEGTCALCQGDSQFYCDFLYTNNVNGNTVPNWRETLICEKCGMRNRMRGSLHVLFQEFLPEKNSKIYITEQLTIAYRWLRGRFNNVTGSEFINNNIISGTTIRSIRHENIERSSFSDESFDLVLSFDILEHVADIDAAILEIHRILAPGGRLFMTAPTNLNAEATLIRASLTSDGIIEHYEEPEYHGNPADPSGGSLCFRHFGWDFLDILREKGFIEPEILLWWDAKFGYLQSPQFAITAVRPGT